MPSRDGREGGVVYPAPERDSLSTPGGRAAPPGKSVRGTPGPEAPGCGFAAPCDFEARGRALSVGPPESKTKNEPPETPGAEPETSACGSEASTITMILVATLRGDAGRPILLWPQNSAPRYAPAGGRSPDSPPFFGRATYAGKASPKPHPIYGGRKRAPRY